MRPKVKITICALAAVAAVAGLIPDGASAMDKKVVVGWVERVRIFPGNLVVTAKLDTGADNSSLHVADFQLFTRDGSQWVRFEAFDEAGRTVSLERPVVRMAKIKRHKEPGQNRPVVLLGICLGDYRADAEVNLVDRSRFSYLMLIGRSFLREGFLVDSASEYLTEPTCTKDGEKE
ncbi:MAG: RimK/LysX family protein [Thermodesulfobacteriota bacterium]